MAIEFISDGPQCFDPLVRELGSNGRESKEGKMLTSCPEAKERKVGYRDLNPFRGHSFNALRTSPFASTERFYYLLRVSP